MAIIAAVLSLERAVSWSPQLATAVGMLAGIAGVVLIVARRVAVAPDGRQQSV